MSRHYLLPKIKFFVVWSLLLFRSWNILEGKGAEISRPFVKTGNRESETEVQVYL